MKKASADKAHKSILNFPKWLQEVVGRESGESANENWGEVWDISTLLSVLAKAYKNIVAYENHFKATSWSSNCSMVTFDCGVMNQFERTPPMTKENPNPEAEPIYYVGEC